MLRRLAGIVGALLIGGAEFVAQNVIGFASDSGTDAPEQLIVPIGAVKDRVAYAYFDRARIGETWPPAGSWSFQEFRGKGA